MQTILFSVSGYAGFYKRNHYIAAYSEDEAIQKFLEWRKDDYFKIKVREIDMEGKTVSINFYELNEKGEFK